MCYSSLIVTGSPSSSDSSVSSSFTADAGGSELSVNNDNTSQTTCHDGTSLSKQHTTNLLLCHVMNAVVYARPLPEATSTTVHKWNNLYSIEQPTIDGL